MAKSTDLIDQLKKVLKLRGMTYQQLAKKLAISEASVKRTFSTYHCSLERLDAICDVLELDITDLANLIAMSQKSISHLSEQQERELVANPRLLLVAVCARNHWTFDQITSNFRISKAECVQLLAHLDRIRFLELLPNNRIKLLVASDFRWLPNGPVEGYYAKHVEKDYFDCKFDKKYERRLFLTGGISEQSRIILIKKIEALAMEFQDLHKSDYSEPLNERENYALVLAVRPWQLKAFHSLRRTNQDVQVND